MGLYDAIKALEEEVIELLAAGTSEPLKSIGPGNIRRGIRALTQYASGDFPLLEVSVSEAPFTAGGTEKREWTFATEISAWIKESEPDVGIETSKELIGAVYDALILKPELDCNADLLADGRLVVMPSLKVGDGNWLYVSVLTLNYHKRM